MFIIVTPPFQSPDEPEHFYRAYEISEGYVIGQQADNRNGGYLPQSVVEIAKFFLILRWNPEKQKTTSAGIIKEFKVPLHPEQKQFVDFPNTAIYPPLAYIPQVITISIVRWMQIAPLWIFYLTRLSSLICWTLLVFQAIKIIPGFKWFVTMLALLPMSLSINSSVSADVLNNGVCFLFIACVFKSAFGNKQVTAKDWWIAIILIMILASSKIIYASIALLVVIIPGSKFNSRNSKYFFIAIIFTIAFLTMFFWSAIISKLYIPYEAYNPAFREGKGLLPGIDMRRQLNSVIAKPLYVIEIISYSIATNYKMYTHAYIGIFGWLEIFLPDWTVLFAYFGILIVLFLDQPFTTKTVMRFRFIFLTVSAVMIYLVFFSQLLNYTPPGNRLIEGVQGRYFIPVFPLLFLVIHANLFPPAKFISLIVICLSGLLLSVSIFMIFQWYYW